MKDYYTDSLAFDRYLQGRFFPELPEYQHQAFPLFRAAAVEAADYLLDHQASFTLRDVIDFMMIDSYSALILQRDDLTNGRQYLEFILEAPMESFDGSYKAVPGTKWMRHNFLIGLIVPCE